MDTKDLRGLMEAYTEVHAPQEVEEAVKGESSERRKALAAERRAGLRPKSAKEGEAYASHKLSQMAYVNRQGMGEEVKLDIFDVVLEFLQAEGYAETLEEAEWMMANVIDEEAIDIILGESSSSRLPGESESEFIMRRRTEYNRPRRGPQHETTPSSSRPRQPTKMERDPKSQSYSSKSKEKPGKSSYGRVKEEYVDEAQAARENPEKANDEYKKKYGHVRGEKTPMPPPGSQRRNEFEKWYAANVR